ncbi:predicted protein [Nematostella vectensis]|uniref:Uncharacterized protein n=1 Tax=Nematostella vectensis TaxID=45351 RepID=A7T1N9_NEMVE|nr:predicted protein [Nematostella vectensis]|eukprot:XP_001622224.1 predicted protein [Nematostella vectensis]
MIYNTGKLSEAVNIPFGWDMSSKHSYKLDHGQNLAKHYNRLLRRNKKLSGMSLRFCGYQIAYFLWGYLIMFAILVAVVLFISLCVVILPSLLDPEIINIIINILIGLVPTVALALFVWLFQKILAVFVFKDRSINSKVVNIDNRRCYLLLSFFFFFFNILVGLMSCVLRILKGMLLGIMFIGRIDRPLLMKGFTGMDTDWALNLTPLPKKRAILTNLPPRVILNTLPFP